MVSDSSVAAFVRRVTVFFFLTAGLCGDDGAAGGTGTKRRRSDCRDAADSAGGRVGALRLAEHQGDEEKGNRDDDDEENGFGSVHGLASLLLVCATFQHQEPLLVPDVAFVKQSPIIQAQVPPPQEEPPPPPQDEPPEEELHEDEEVEELQLEAGEEGGV